MSPLSLPELFAKIEELQADTAVTQHLHYKDFTDLPRDLRHRFVELARSVGLAEKGLDKKDADWVQLREKWLELFGSTREALTEGCVSLKQNGEFCGRELEGDMQINAQRCGLHRECHPFARVGARAARGQAVLSCRKKGDCLVCLSKFKAGEGVADCLSCEGRAHAECVQQQFAVDPTALEGANVVCFCSACVVALYHEVLFLETEAQLVGSDKTVVFEVCTERYRESSDENLWFEARRELERQGLLGVRAAAQATQIGTPFGKREATSYVTPQSKMLVDRPESSGVKKPDTPRAAQMVPAGHGDSEIYALIKDLLLAKQTGVHTKPAPVILKGEVGSVDPTGEIDGFKEGEQGAPNTLQYLSLFPYTGMNASPKSVRNTIQRLSGATRLDLRTSDQYWPETTTKNEKVWLGNVELECTATKRGVPDRSVVSLFWQNAKKEVLGIRACGVGVYSPSHPAFDDFQQTVTLMDLRFDFLECLIVYLSTRMNLQWGVVWRYVLAFVQDRFLANTVHNLGELDRRMWETHRGGSWELQVGELVSGTLMYHHIRRAEEAVLALARAANPHTTGKTESAKPGPKSYAVPIVRDCRLCGSSEHAYSKGHYDHPADQPITIPCNNRLRDGELCNLLHAFSGPLRTPCRGGLREMPRGAQTR